MKNLSFQMVLVNAFMLILWAGCATAKEPTEMKEVRVTFVRVVEQKRFINGQYVPRPFYVYVDDEKEEYTLERDWGPSTTIQLKK
jgi:hypothetical protein